MTNVNATVIEMAPVGGNGTKGWKLGYLITADKAAQNDTVTVTNANEVGKGSNLRIDATGAAETYTVSTNVITLTSSTTGAISGLLAYR